MFQTKDQTTIITIIILLVLLLVMKNQVEKRPYIFAYVPFFNGLFTNNENNLENNNVQLKQKLTLSKLLKKLLKLYDKLTLHLAKALYKLSDLFKLSLKEILHLCKDLIKNTLKHALTITRQIFNVLFHPKQIVQFILYWGILYAGLYFFGFGYYKKLTNYFDQSKLEILNAINKVEQKRTFWQELVYSFGFSINESQLLFVATLNLVIFGYVFNKIQTLLFWIVGKYSTYMFDIISDSYYRLITFIPNLVLSIFGLSAMTYNYITYVPPVEQTWSEWMLDNTYGRVKRCFINNPIGSLCTIGTASLALAKVNPIYGSVLGAIGSLLSSNGSYAPTVEQPQQPANINIVNNIPQQAQPVQQPSWAVNATQSSITGLASLGICGLIAWIIPGSSSIIPYAQPLINVGISNLPNAYNKAKTYITEKIQTREYMQWRQNRENQ